MFYVVYLYLCIYCPLCVVCCVLCAVCCVCAVCSDQKTNGLWGTSESDDSVWCCSDENEIHSSSKQKTYALQQQDEIDYVLQIEE
jgi:hypothetical protein